MRVQAQQMLKNPTLDQLQDVALELIDAELQGAGDENTDDHFEIVMVRTPNPRQSPLAEAAGIPLIPRG
jgi:hypothetical protein